MKKIGFSFFLIFIFYALISAQEEIVKQIRQDYIDYNKKLEQMETEMSVIPAPFRIKTTQIRPALGPVDIEITYFYDEEYVDAENMVTKAILRKIVQTESMPSFTDYREYFFDSKGKLLFYYSKLTGYTCGEKRMYFSAGKMIKIKFNPLEGKECFEDSNEDKFPDFTRYSGKYTPDDLSWEKSLTKLSEIHKTTFKNLFDSL